MRTVLRGIAGCVWANGAPPDEEAYSTPLASSFVAGEALLVLVFFSVLAVFGIRV